MLKYFIDGSRKGLVLGAGVVEVDKFGFMKTHEAHTMHPRATSYFAELFALDLALEKAINSKESSILIYVDTYHIENLFEHRLIDGEVVFTNALFSKESMSEQYILFISQVKEKVKFFYDKKLKPNLTIKKLTKEDYDYTVYVNTAHVLSRCYFKAGYDELYLQNNTPLKKSGEVAKFLLNNATSCDDIEIFKLQLQVIRKDGMWYSFLQNEAEPFVRSKHLVNIFVHSHANLLKEFGLEEGEVKLEFKSNLDLKQNIEQSISYFNCPQDIKNKGNWIYEMIEQGKIKITCNE